MIEHEEIEDYLEKAKALIRANRCQNALNENRQANLQLFLDYALTEADAKGILLSLEKKDFKKVVQNRKQGYEHEILYIFEKRVVLKPKYKQDYVEVTLYIKFNMIDNIMLYVISLHE